MNDPKIKENSVESELISEGQPGDPKFNVGALETGRQAPK